MIVIDDVSKCCGCEACVQRCPRGCIEMKADHEGFFYPSVDTLQCIGCGACAAICDEVFEMNDEGLSEVVVDTVQEENEESVKEAIESCPTGAIEEE